MIISRIEPGLTACQANLLLGVGQAQKIHPDYLLMHTRPEIECLCALVCTISSQVNKNGRSLERIIQTKIVVKPIKIWLSCNKINGNTQNIIYLKE